MGYFAMQQGTHDDVSEWIITVCGKGDIVMLVSELLPRVGEKTL